MGGSVTVRLNLNATGYSGALTRAQTQMTRFKKTTEDAGHGSVSSMQATSGALRLVEGDITRNTRAVERFLTTIPGVGKALTAAFPLVGALALAGVVYRLGEEVYGAVKKVQELRDKSREGFLTMTESALKSVDSLRVTNDKLEESIALLEHKPGNTMVTALDEMRERADELAISLNKDYTAFKKLTDENQVGILGRLMGKGSTKEVASGTQDRLANMRTLGLQAQTQMLAGDTAGADATGVLIQKAQKEALEWAKSQYAMRSGRQQYQADGSIAYGKEFKNGPSVAYAGANGDQGQNLDTLQSFQTIVGTQLQTAQEQQRNIADQAKQKQLEEAKQRDEDAKRAAEAARRAQELIVQQWHKDLDEQKANTDTTVAQEAQFWVRRMEESRKGSISYLAALDEANKGIARMRAEDMRGNAEFEKTAAGIQIDDLSRSDNQENKAEGAGAVEYLRNLNQGIALQRANADAIAEASLRMAEMTGQVSRLDAAQARAALHAQEYKHAQDDLADALEAAKSLPEGFEKKQWISGLENQRTEMEGQRAIQVMQDSQDVSGNTIKGAVSDSLREMVQSFTDMASTLKAVIPRTIEGLNDNLVKLMTGQGKKGDVGRTLLGAGQGFLKGALQAGEGKLLGPLLGHGANRPQQLGSSENNALWVRMASMQAGASSGSVPLPAGIAGSALGHIPGFSSIADWIRPFQGHFANGGDILANRPAIVGERGPEMFMPGVSGRIIPNHALSGGDNHTHFHVDARGATDPAAVHAAIMRAAPHIVSGAIQAQHQKTIRSTRGR